jgi:phytanoyl-CoA hydroxylase
VTALSPQQLRSFADDGYIVVPDLLGADEVAAHNANLSRLVRESDDQGRHPAPGVSVQFERGFAAAGRSADERELAVRKFFQFGPADPFFWASVRDRRIRDLLDGLLGPGARLLQSMAMVKPPGIGSPKEWHQDIPYFPIGSAADCLGVWIATDDATLENGCIQVVPGSHREGPVPHVEGPTGWRLSDERVAGFADRVRPVPVRAGSALVFSSALFHFSDHNRSPLRRRALQYHYVSAAAQAKKEIELADLDSPAPPRLAAALR